MLGGLLKRQRKYQDALDYYHRAAEVAPSSWNSLVNAAAVSVLAAPDSPDVGLQLTLSTALRALGLGRYASRRVGRGNAWRGGLRTRQRCGSRRPL